MRRIFISILIACGVCCIAVGVMMGAMPSPAWAQDELEDADYIGSGDCRDCHRSLARDHAETPHALALQDASRSDDVVLADFSQGEDLRLVQFPGEDAPRPFEAGDIAFVIGAGRYAQAYLYELGDDEYAVFPVQWDIASATWQPALRAESWPDPAYDWVQNCAGCHTTGLDVERGRWEDDGVQCEACHGPGSLHAELADDAGSRPNDSERAEIHAAIVMTPDAGVCGQCHSLGIDPETNHPFPLAYRPGQDLLESGAFQLAGAEDPSAWWATGHARQSNMQLNEWLNSAHASALETITDSSNAQDGCLQCHSGDYLFTERIRALVDAGDLEGDPPDSLTLETAQYGLTCTTCHSPHTAVEVEFNLVDEPNTLCTTCHQNTTLTETLHHPVREMFEGQPIVEGIDGVPAPHFIEESGPRCVTCHMPGVPAGGFVLASHLWQPVLPGAEEDSPSNACIQCHDDLTTSDLQSLVEDTQADVRSRLSIARARVATVPQPEAGTDAALLYQQVVTALTFVQNDGSQGVHNYAYADALLDAASGLLTQLSVPGAVLQPTEAPAPTATLSSPQPVTVALEREVTTGFRPITIILIGLSLLILFGGGAIIARQSRRKSQSQEVSP